MFKNARIVILKTVMNVPNAKQASSCTKAYVIVNVLIELVTAGFATATTIHNAESAAHHCIMCQVVIAFLEQAVTIMVIDLIKIDLFLIIETCTINMFCRDKFWDGLYFENLFLLGKAELSTINDFSEVL